MAVRGLGGDRFLVIGRAGMDLYADPPGTPIEEAARFTSALGGSSANIAAGIARQGGRAALLTRVSDDAVGRFCLGQLDAYGVDRSLVAVEGGEARNSLSVVDTNGAATQAVIYRLGAADLAMTEEDAARPDYAAFDALIATGTVLTAEPSRGATFAAFEHARAAGLPAIFDIDHRPYSWPSAEDASRAYARAAALSDIVIGNDVEFALLAGDPERGLDAARDLIARGAWIVVHKMGAEGAVTLTAEGETRTGVFPTKALKPTGAGDAFMAGFVTALAYGAPVAEAVWRGSATAAIVVSRVGCAPACPTREELDAFLRDAPDTL